MSASTRELNEPKVDEPAEAQLLSEGAPPSFAQQRLWFVDQLWPGNPAYHVPVALRLTGRLDVAVAEQSMAEVVRRHEALRTVFRTIAGRLIQVLLDDVPCPLPVVDLSHLPLADRELAAAHRMAAEFRQPFDLERGPLLRAGLLRMAPEDHVLWLEAHHIACDGRSIGILFQDFAALYAAFLRGEPSPLPSLPVPYADYAVSQRNRLRGEILRGHLHYWKKQLDSLPETLELRTDRPRPAEPAFRGGQRLFSLSPDLTESLESLGRREGAWLFMTLLAGFQALLQRYTGQHDIAVGTPVADRPRRELHKMIGCFLNVVVLRTDLSGDPSFRELLRRVRAMALRAYAHQELPFERLVEELRPARVPDRQPMFQAMLTLQDDPTTGMTLPGLKITSIVDVHCGASQYDLKLSMTRTKTGLDGALEYDSDLFDAATIDRMIGHFQVLLGAAVADPDRRLSDLPLLTDSEQRNLLVDWNQTDADFPREACLQDLFEAQAARTPERIALAHDGRQWTYRELNERADRLADYLKTLGVAPDVLVGLLAERSLEIVLGALGILKAGGAYLPLDPTFPSERLGFMLDDARPPVVLTQQKLEAALPVSPACVLHIDDFVSDAADAARASAESNRQAQTAAAPTAAKPSSTSLAYVLFTSGSTGRPKGVEISQRSLVNLLWSMRREPGLTGDDVLLAVTTLSFDIAALEIFLPLICGATVVIANRETTVDGKRLAKLLTECGATVMQATPATWRMLVEAGWQGSPRLKVLCGGESLSPDLADQLLARCAELWNVYGPTETTIWSTVCRVWPGQPIVVGRPIANTQCYILDANRRPAPVGCAGELLIGGEGLARGYRNRPELTLEKFVPNPFSDQPGSRLYRTGDLARYKPDGNIECLGRTDRQVKIRGFRIELDEIEAALALCPGVAQSVVVAREDRPGDKRLVAYLAPQTDAELTASSLRATLRQRLPEYMIPAAFVTLPRLPLTPNGKLDRQALPAPDLGSLESDGLFVAPQTPAEKKLAAIWADALGLENVGIHDDFFELGGHSLLGIRVIAEIEKAFGKRLPLAVLFQRGNIERLAHLLQETSEEQSKIKLVAINSSGFKPRLIFLPSLFGETTYAHKIAEHLGADYPVFGAQPTNPVGDGRHTKSLDEIAARCVDDLCELCPNEVFLLAGYSFAGILAYEVARQLVVRGRQVGLLAVIDTWLSSGESRTLTSVFRDSLSVVKNVPTWVLHNVVRSRQNGFWPTMYRHFHKAAKRTRRVLASGSMAALSPQVEDIFDIRHWPENYLQMIEANMRAARDYVPKPYPGRLTLIRARTRPLLHSYREEDLGWGKWAAGGIEIKSVGGHHSNILDEPSIRAVAAHLRTAINRAAETSAA